MATTTTQATTTAAAAKSWKRCATSSGEEQVLCAPKRRSIESATHSGNSNRSSGDFAAAPSPTCSDTSFGPGRASSAPTPASPQPHVGVPAAEQPSHSSKAPAVGVPLAMPTGFGLPFPFMPPPLMFFWMQQMAVQHAATYLNSQHKDSSTSSVPCAPPPSSAACPPDVWDMGMDGSCPATSPSCSSMPQPQPFPPSGSPHSISSLPPPAPLPSYPTSSLPPSQLPEPTSCPSMPMPMPVSTFPGCPPPPPPAMPMPDLAHLPPPDEFPPVAESLGNSTIGGEMCAAGKVDCGSSNSSVSEAGYVDNDVASFIDSFLLSGPEQSLHYNTPQVDLLATDTATPPLGLHLSHSAAEEVLDVLVHHNDDDGAGDLEGLMAGLPPAAC